jgi:Tol biopolymer transport system component
VIQKALSKDRVAGNFSYWSPDGKKLAFGSERQVENRAATHIWIIDLEKQLGEVFLSLR